MDLQYATALTRFLPPHCTHSLPCPAVISDWFLAGSAQIRGDGYVNGNMQLKNTATVRAIDRASPWDGYPLRFGLHSLGRTAL